MLFPWLIFHPHWYDTDSFGLNVRFNTTESEPSTPKKHSEDVIVNPFVHSCCTQTQISGNPGNTPPWSPRKKMQMQSQEMSGSPVALRGKYSPRDFAENPCTKFVSRSLLPRGPFKLLHPNKRQQSRAGLGSHSAPHNYFNWARHLTFLFLSFLCYQMVLTIAITLI